MRLDREAAEFIGARPVRSPRVRPRQKRARESSPIEKDARLGCTRYPTGFRTHSFPSPHAIEAGCVKTTCSPLSEGRVSFRSSLSITHNLHGAAIEPIRIPGPVLRTYASKADMMAPATTYMNNLMFEVYVRVVSNIRRMRFFNAPYPGAEIDAILSEACSAPVIAYSLPDELNEEPFRWKSIPDIVELVCRVSDIEFFDVNLIRDADSQSSVSSDSE